MSRSKLAGAISQVTQVVAAGAIVQNVYNIERDVRFRRATCGMVNHANKSRHLVDNGGACDGMWQCKKGLVKVWSMPTMQSIGYSVCTTS